MFKGMFHITCILGGIRRCEKVYGRCVCEVYGVWKGRYCNASKGHVDFEPRKGLLLFLASKGHVDLSLERAY